MIPAAPTDNLYKFITFLGIALFVFCSWTLSDLVLRTDREVSKAEAASLSGERKLSLLTEVTASLEASRAAINERLSRRDQTPMTEQETAALLARAERLIQESIEAKTALTEVERDYNSILPVTAEARVLLRYYDAHLRILNSGAILGLAMTFVGSTMWYLLHQRYQDALLKQQLDAGATQNNTLINEGN